MNKSTYIIIALIITVTAALWYTAQRKQTVKPLNTIIVGTNAEFPPFSFKKGDEITGFDIDIITEVAKRLGKEIVIKDMPFDTLIPELQLGNLHVIAAGITPTPERAKRVLFTKPHLTGDTLAIIGLKKNSPINDIHDLHGKEVVVNEGYTADAYISKHHGPIITRLSSASPIDGILALQSGRAYAFISALRPLQAYFDKVGTQDFQIIPIEGTTESSALAISKFHPELRDYIQIMLDQMEEDGTIEAIKKKWDM